MNRHACTMESKWIQTMLNTNTLKTDGKLKRQIYRNKYTYKQKEDISQTLHLTNVQV